MTDEERKRNEEQRARREKYWRYKKIKRSQIYAMSDEELLKLWEENDVPWEIAPCGEWMSYELFARKIHPKGLWEDRLEELLHSPDYFIVRGWRRDYEKYLRARAKWQWEQIPDTRSLRVIRCDG